MTKRWTPPARRTILQISADSLGLALAYIGSFYLRFNMMPGPRYLQVAYETLPVVITTTIVGLVSLRVYRMMWRYLSINDLAHLARALMAGILLATTILVFWNRLAQYPRTVLPIYAISSMFILCSIRIIGRSWFDNRSGLKPPKGPAQRVLLVGAGRAAELLLRDLDNNTESNLFVAGLLDDNPIKHGRLIRGARVVGRIKDLPQIISSEEIERVIFCIPSAANSLRQQVLESCSKVGVRIETLPRLTDLAEGKVTVNQIREFALEDLLGRNAVALNEQAVANFLNTKVVMITGAGGSIGSEICRQIAQYGPTAILLFERSEIALFTIENELRLRFPKCSLLPILGDIQDKKRIDEILETHQPHVVFHAAAYKHVPLVEMNPFEAVANNIAGSLVVAESCSQHNVERFVLISTDKAVNPTSFMGATKRIAERICQAIGSQASTTIFTTVRFGNVIGSSGSVIPTFRKQIAQGGPITLTHKDIERFFMTIPEAAQLVLQASTLSDGDETFILEMGKPVKIIDLAKQMIHLSGLKEEEIDIEITGLRPGEKLYEELIIDGEDHTTTTHQKILKVTRKKQDSTRLLLQVRQLLEASHARDAAMVGKLTSTLVDNYQPGESHLKRYVQ